MNNKYLKSVAVIAILALAAVVGIAQSSENNSGRGGPGGHHHSFMGYLVEELQLTDSQQAQVKSMWQAEKATSRPLMQQLEASRKQMLELTAHGNFDQAKVTALANQNAPIMAQLMVQKEKLMSQVYNQVLTPEQRTKMDTMRAQHEEHIDRALQHLTDSMPSPE
jgi:periplasmic protein CpxP/Spy